MKFILDWFDTRVLPKLNSVLPNPSGQNQLSDHTFPTFFATMLLLLVPFFPLFAALTVPIGSLVKELIVDEHYKDLFKKDDDTPYGPADGRCDLFYRLLGSALAYGYFFLN